MLVTVITVCRNAEKSIRDAIESVLSQDFNDFEYLVVDGKSTDTTYEIVCSYDDEFKAKGITYRHVSESDKGIYDAMNKACKIAEGEWVIFINADDAFYNETVLSDIFRDDVSGYDVIYGNVYRISEDRQYEDKASPIKNITLTMPFCHQSSITRRELVSFDPKYITADYKLFLGLYLSGKKFKQTDITFAKFAMDGYSNQNRLRTYQDTVAVKAEYGLVKQNSLKQKIKDVYHKMLLDEKAPGHKLAAKHNAKLTEKRKHEK